MSRKRRKADKTGRSAADQFAVMYYELLKSDAFRSLSGPAVKVFFELRSRFNGHNNGKITLSLDECKKLLAMGKPTAQRAFKDLQAKGFVRLAVLGRWYGRKASEWELTTEKRDGHPPTNEWRLWKAQKPLREAKKVAVRFQGGFVECFEGSATKPKH